MIDLHNARFEERYLEVAPQSAQLVIADLNYGITDAEWDARQNLDDFWMAADHVLSPSGVVAVFASGTFTFDVYNSRPNWYRYVRRLRDEDDVMAIVTLLCDDNGVYYFSPEQWNHAPSGQKAQRDRWEYLGYPGFALEQKHHDRRNEIFEMFGDMVPTYFGEWSQVETFSEGDIVKIDDDGILTGKVMADVGRSTVLVSVNLNGFNNPHQHIERCRLTAV